MRRFTLCLVPLSAGSSVVGHRRGLQGLLEVEREDELLQRREDALRADRTTDHDDDQLGKSMTVGDTTSVVGEATIGSGGYLTQSGTWIFLVEWRIK